MSDGGDPTEFTRHKLSILGAIETLNRGVAEVATEQRKTALAVTETLARHGTRVEALEAKAADIERRTRELEVTRSQASALSPLAFLLVSGVVSAIVAILVKVIAR